MAQRQRICIIGGGVSGICMAKSLLERGIEFDLYEKSDALGGLWVFGNRNGLSAAYRSLHIDSSRYSSSFDDFPMPDDFPDFPHHTQMAAYFNQYADHFGVRDRVRFNTTVTHAARNSDGAWSVELDTGEKLTYDWLIVCNGHHWSPRWPEPPFPGTFTGQQIHSHDYVDAFQPLDMHGKRVLVVGIGNSAMDIACELSHRGVASRLIVSTRRGAHIVPKYLYGMPTDRFFRPIRWLPMGPQRRMATLLYRIAVGRMENYRVPTPRHSFWQAHPTTSSEFLLRAGSGDLVVKPNIRRLDGDRVWFEDETSAEFDAIVWATGYKIEFPFFDPSLISAPDNVLPLFKRAIKPGIPNLLFVGLAQAIPSVIKFSEMQSRWLAAYVAGEYALPTEAEMQAAIVHDQQVQSGEYVPTKRHTMQIDCYRYGWDLDRELKQGKRRAKRRPAPLVS